MKFERIQILRLLAASAVVVFHTFGSVSNYYSGQTHAPWTGYGYLGVDLFFVISGFIIHYTLRTRERDWRLFLKRRIYRVVPMYWLISFFTFALSHLISANHAPPSFDLLVRSLFFLSWTAGLGATPVVYLGWSLEYEMFFYLSVALAMILSSKPWVSVTVALSSLIALGRLLDAQHGNVLELFAMNPLIVEFLLGALISEALLNRRLSRLSIAAVIVAIAFVPFSGWGTRLWIGGMSGAALVTGAAWLDARRPGVRPFRLLARLGDASYSIYLVQLLAIPAMFRILVRTLPSLSADMAAIAAAVMSIVCSYAVYCFVERPLQKLAHTKKTDVEPAHAVVAIP